MQNEGTGERSSRGMLQRMFGCTLSLIYLSRLKIGEKVTEELSVLQGAPVPGAGPELLCGEVLKGISPRETVS